MKRSDEAVDGKSSAVRPPDDPQGISLDQLSGAFAEMLGSGSDPYDEAHDPAVEPEVPVDEAQVAHELAACGVSPRSIFEAMLFVGHPENRPLTSREVASLMRGVRAAEIDQLVRELNSEYAEDGCPYEIASVDAGYCLVLREEFGRVRDKFYGRRREARLSQAAIEVLSIVAYLQPVTAEEVNHRRGTSCGAMLSQLVRRELLRMERPEEKPRTPRYFTTPRFLQFFGLESLDDLPQAQDLGEP